MFKQISTYFQKIMKGMQHKQQKIVRALRLQKVFIQFSRFQRRTNFIKNNKIALSLFVISVVVLSIVTFWRVLTFGFLRDDWVFLWATQYQPHIPLAWYLHPGTQYEDFLLFPLFGWNVFYWQAFGIFLRILASFSVALMLWGFFRSKRVAILGGLFFSSSFIGLETVSWRSVHVVAVDIIFISLGYFLYSEYIRQKKILYFLFGFIFFEVAVLADPARVIPLVPITLLFFILSLVTTSRQVLKKLIPNIFLILVSFAILIGTFMLSASYQGSGGIKQIYAIVQDPLTIRNFFVSLGNLMFGWFINIPEYGSLVNANLNIGRAAFILLFSSSIIALYITVVKKSQRSLFLFVSICWIMIFYFPNWVFEKTLVVGGTHRYLGLAGLGFICILAILVSMLRKKYLIFAAGIFIVLNIMTANRVLKSESSYRDRIISDVLWNRILADVQVGEKNSIFMYLGSDPIRGSLLDWSEATPFAVKRRISNPYDIPIATADDTLILNLLCKQNTSRPTVSQWVVEKTRIPLSHVHAWDVTNGMITNVSKREQERLNQKAEAEGCTPEL